VYYKADLNEPIFDIRASQCMAQSASSIKIAANAATEIRKIMAGERRRLKLTESPWGQEEWVFNILSIRMDL
jgi:hypothetical protein